MNPATLSMLQTALSTFVGAFAAFQLEAHRKKTVELKNNRQAFVKAQGYLQLQKSRIHTLKKQLDLKRNNPQRTGLLGPISFDINTPYIDLSLVEFMLGEANVLALNIVNLQGNIRSIFDQLEERNEQHKRVQKTVHESFKDGDEKKIYNINYKLLKDMTDDLYSLVDNTSAMFEKLYNEFESYGLQKFKDTKSCKIKIKESPNTRINADGK